MKVGDIVLVQGYEFRIERIWLSASGNAYFIGTCTDSERNDSIRGTGYDGGAYALTSARIDPRPRSKR